ncbi:MAG: hypothetical protein KDA44_16995 [Planctomycetales bacterium]|nr:hypothetical protein [Planctomycetales bacterium]
MTDVIRIAMWSGPRNISTAMMRSWGSRPDTFVCDEPLYAHYLQATGATHHPGYAETIAGHETDWRKVVPWLTGPIPQGKTVFYQKQMAHHLLPEIDRAWIDQLANVLLIREPREMLTSLLEFIPRPLAEHTGLPQQVELLGQLRTDLGVDPPIIDARDVLDDPEGMLRKLCERLGLPFYDEMLNWPAGQRDTDGAWAPFWYDKVYQTTTFGKYRPKDQPVPEDLAPVLAECEALYAELYEQRLC